MNCLELIKEGSVCFYGLGRESKALVSYLIAKNLLKEVVYCDQNEVFLDSIAVPYRKVNLAALGDFRVIFKSPGVSLYQDVLKEAAAKGAVILSPSQLFFDLHKSYKICVTGSKGKSTFCSLLGDLLNSFGVKAAVAGNIGLPLLNLIEQEFEVVVAEVSSYQLASLNFQGELGVITSLFPEHLSWHLSEAQYYKDKLRIAEQCRRSFVFSGEAFSLVKKISNTLSTQLLDTTSLPAIDFDSTYFRAPHLKELAKGAICTLCEYLNKAPGELKPEEITLIQSCLRDFTALPHRLEVFYDSPDIMAVDDSISTAPQAVIAALMSFDSAHEIHLFLGGDDRGVSQQPLISYLSQRVDVQVHSYSKTGWVIHQALNDKRSYYSPSLDLVIEANKEKFLASKGKNKVLLLLSPGAPSHDQFKSFEQRGELFKSLIKTFLTKAQ
jgi:UDP-N-acetylmuramoylalanine--D-glutamate ligase